MIGAEATKIVAENPREQLAAKVGTNDPAEWAGESYRIGCSSVYPPDSEAGNNRAVPIVPHHAAQARGIAEQRIALAGYRLANVLNEIVAK